MILWLFLVGVTSFVYVWFLRKAKGIKRILYLVVWGFQGLYVWVFFFLVLYKAVVSFFFFCLFILCLDAEKMVGNGRET